MYVVQNRKNLGDRERERGGNKLEMLKQLSSVI